MPPRDAASPAAPCPRCELRRKRGRKPSPLRAIAGYLSAIAPDGSNDPATVARAALSAAAAAAADAADALDALDVAAGGGEARAREVRIAATMLARYALDVRADDDAAARRRGSGGR